MEKSLKKLAYVTDELYRIRESVMSHPLPEEEVVFLESQAKEGCPLGELLLCHHRLIHEGDKEMAAELFERFIKHANGPMLWGASCDFAYLSDYLRDDDLIEWSLRCLKRSAWRQFPIAKAMWKDMKEHPFRFPQA